MPGSAAPVAWGVPEGAARFPLGLAAGEADVLQQVRVKLGEMAALAGEANEAQKARGQRGAAGA